MTKGGSKERGSVEKKLGRTLTCVEGLESQRSCRSTTDAAIGFDDEDDNGEGVALGKRWCEHGKDLDETITTVVAAWAERDQRR